MSGHKFELKTRIQFNHQSSAIRNLMLCHINFTFIWSGKYWSPTIRCKRNEKIVEMQNISCQGQCLHKATCENVETGWTIFYKSGSAKFNSGLLLRVDINGQLIKPSLYALFSAPRQSRLNKSSLHFSNLFIVVRATSVHCATLHSIYTCLL